MLQALSCITEPELVNTTMHCPSRAMAAGVTETSSAQGCQPAAALDQPTWNKLLIMLTHLSSTSFATSLSELVPLLLLILLRPMKMANSCARAPASIKRSQADGELQKRSVSKVQ